MRAEKTPAVKTELFLQVGEIDVYAQVAWRKGDTCGLKFERPLDAWCVEKLRVDCNRGTKADLKAAEKGGADDWSTGVAR